MYLLLIQNPSLNLLTGYKQAAEERYSREVIAHAEAIKAIEDLKRRIHDLQLSDRNNRTAAETAEAKLSTSEGSWSQQRQALEREISDLAARYDYACLACGTS